jgi:RNA polymerase sigma-70 factor, ECF subfamily
MTPVSLCGAFRAREPTRVLGILHSGDEKKEETLEAVAGLEATDSTPKTPGPGAILRNMAGLRAQLARVTGSAELAADLLQDAVVTALQKLNAGEISDPAHLDGYVYRVAVNHLLNHRRKDRSHTHCESVDEVADATEAGLPTESVEADQWAQVARRLLQEVHPVRDRELLVRFYLKEERKEELCRELGLTESHFNRVIYRARQRFRELLQRRGLSKSDFLAIIGLLTLLGARVGSHGI